MSIEWHHHLNVRGEKLREVGYTDSIILYVEVSSKRRGTYRVTSNYTGRGSNSVLVYERAKVFKSLDSAKEWLIVETLQVLTMLSNDLKGLK